MAIQIENEMGTSAPVPLPDSVATYGALSLLAAHCPLHRSYSAELLNRLFLPAIEHQSGSNIPDIKQPTLCSIDLGTAFKKCFLEDGYLRSASKSQ